jgi:squalene-hopene/tetraprenyl-beta-curcumene cyclase
MATRGIVDFSQLFDRPHSSHAPPVPIEILLDRDIHPDPPHTAAALALDDRLAPTEVDRAIRRAADHLISLRRGGNHWCAELESNIQIEAQWILCRRYIGAVDTALERRLVRRMKETQEPDGGWKLYDGSGSHLSITIQAYFAAKLAGASPDEPWMRRCRDYIRAQGGVEKANVITKIYLALFGQWSWAGVPAMPITVMFMPLGTVFNIYEMSYWARTCVVPLLILYHKKKEYPTPPEAAIDELYTTPREQLSYRWEEKVPGLSWRNFFKQADRALKAWEKLRLQFRYQDRALALAERWVLDHQDEDGGWGGIFPAMTHSVMALHALGYALDAAPVKKGLEAIAGLEITEGEVTRVQPCLSPVWDTAWAVIALAKAGYGRDDPVMREATDWLYARQIRRKGDWAVKCPNVPAGGWAFQYHNDFYPDTDDSSAVLMALLNSHYRTDDRKKESFDLGLKWLLGLQNDDGGWGAFEKGVQNEIWNEILFNDAKNMLDPSTVDVTGRCLEVLGKLGYPRTHPAVARALRFVKKNQEPDGKWWGRWGVNYIYGTWSALCALRAVKEPFDSPAVARGAAWLESVQNADGGWGESCRSYEGGPAGRAAGSCASQTAWAVLGLLAAGRGAGEACRRGVEWLLRHQKEDGAWDEEAFTGTGFPGVFYLRYHYYRLYFPLLALGRYREIVP